MSADIPWDATEAFIEDALNDLSSIGSVTVEIQGDQLTACQPYNTDTDAAPQLIHVQFTSTPNYSGDVPLLVANTELLTGNRRIAITEILTGEENLSGSFKLSFKDATTDAIAFDASAAEMQTALEALSTIPASGLSVTRSNADGAGGYAWSVTFVHSLLSLVSEQHQELIKLFLFKVSCVCLGAW